MYNCGLCRYLAQLQDVGKDIIKYCIIRLLMSNNSDSNFPWEGVVSHYLFTGVSPSKSDADNFISVWIAFNAWMKGQFGTKRTDRQLINSTKGYNQINKIFERLKRSEDFAAALGSFSDYEITNHKTLERFRYDGTFGSLLDMLYALRGNTIHGTDISGMNSDIYRLASEILSGLLYKMILL